MIEDQDPIVQYLNQFSYKQLCDIEESIKNTIKIKNTKANDLLIKKVNPPVYKSVEQLAESLNLDIRDLIKEAKSWSK